MTAPEIAAAIRKLPLSHTNLVALISTVERYAQDLSRDGALTGMEPVIGALLDAFSATDAVYAITHEQRSEWGEGRMSAITHTRGPWFIQLENNSGSQGTSVWAIGGNVRIARCDSANVSLEGRRADARLIAAAPDLLEQCQRALGAWTGDGPAIFLDELRAAIAKATGSAA